jgi:Fic/DOC family
LSEGDELFAVEIGGQLRLSPYDPNFEKVMTAAKDGVRKVPKRAQSPAYAWGLIRDHPFVDGNKRTALLVANAFCTANGYQLLPGGSKKSVRAKMR